VCCSVLQCAIPSEACKQVGREGRLLAAIEGAHMHGDPVLDDVFCRGCVPVCIPLRTPVPIWPCVLHCVCYVCSYVRVVTYLHKPSGWV